MTMNGDKPPSSTSPPPSSSSSSSPIVRPDKHVQWAKLRPIIERLYYIDNLKLKDVMDIMEREHNFVATYCPPFPHVFQASPNTPSREKQYKDRFSMWGLRKNIKAGEQRIMLRKQQKRAARGKQTAFRVGGQNISSQRISRFARRSSSAWDSSSQRDSRLTESRQSSPEPRTPSDMSCYTPEPEDRRSETLSPGTELPESDTQDEKLSSQVDSESADDGKSSSDPLSPPVSQQQQQQQQQQDPSPSSNATADAAASARRLIQFQEDMNQNTMRLEEYIRALRAERGLSEHPERRSAAVPISYFLGG
ncbi:hypothetical protein PHISP_04812 [Aspergillus sp. HF37]|nr:hypothetical protein PHISP_04812 [Aspergillus sp. HF37]